MGAAVVPVTFLLQRKEAFVLKFLIRTLDRSLAQSEDLCRFLNDRNTLPLLLPLKRVWSSNQSLTAFPDKDRHAGDLSIA